MDPSRILYQSAPVALASSPSIIPLCSSSVFPVFFASSSNCFPVTSATPAWNPSIGSAQDEYTTGTRSLVTWTMMLTYSPLSDVDVTSPFSEFALMSGGGGGAIEPVRSGEEVATERGRWGWNWRPWSCERPEKVGTVVDFQYVSTRPPISSCTPTKGRTTLSSNAT